MLSAIITNNMNIDIIVASLIGFSLLQVVVLIFVRKKSVHSLAIAILLFVSVASLSFYLLGLYGVSCCVFAVPTVFLFGVAFFWAYYHRFMSSFANVIVRIKQLALGNFNDEGAKCNSENEFGELNNSIVLLSSYMKSIVTEIYGNSVSMNQLFVQLKSILDQMVGGEESQEVNLKEISADMKEVIALIAKLSLVDEKTDAQPLLSVKKSTQSQYPNVSYNDITSKIDSSSKIISLINTLSQCIEVEAIRANDMQRNFKGVILELEKIAEKNKQLSGVCRQML